MHSNKVPYVPEKCFDCIINSILDISVTHLLTYLQNIGSNLGGALVNLLLQSVRRANRKEDGSNLAHQRCEAMYFVRCYHTIHDRRSRQNRPTTCAECTAGTPEATNTNVGNLNQVRP